MPSLLKISLALLPVMAAKINAAISEPPNTYYGEVEVDSQPLTANAVQYSVLVKFNGVELDRYTMGDLEQAADNYVLRVPSDAIGNRLENATREGDSVEFYLADAFGSENLLRSHLVGQRGQSHYLKLRWQDSNNDGVNDLMGGSTASAVGNSGSATPGSLSEGIAVSGQQSAALNTENSSLNRSTQQSASEEQPSPSILLSAWVGEENSRVHLPATGAGAALYRSADAECKLVNYSLCDFGQMDIVKHDSLFDSAAQLNQAAYYTLLANKGAGFTGSATLIVDVQQSSPVLPAGAQGLISFNNKLWLVGGGLGSEAQALWSSDDGLNWQQQPVQGELSLARRGHQLARFKQQLWLLGGKNHLGELNEAWVSDDGLNWQARPLPSEFSAQAGLKALHWLENKRLAAIELSLVGEVDALQSAVLNNFLFIVNKDKPQEIWRLDKQGELRKGFVGEFFYGN
ncbi:MAG: hypothetical protein KTR17_00050 [Cellvibrionaceae bacterium]|nr:hypothetical protein [Cellvibrionaceae bacterium]